jgi:hypothetical protein
MALKTGAIVLAEMVEAYGITHVFMVFTIYGSIVSPIEFILRKIVQSQFLPCVLTFK